MTPTEDFVKYQQRSDQFLAKYLPAAASSEPLHEAMRYSVLNGGKRLRPSLVYLFGEALGLPLEKLDQAACAIEFIHAYSLIHDDLPCVDNDDWRRGKPSCHKVFGEAIALLAGDALQTLAFDVLLKSPLPPAKSLVMLNTLIKAVGLHGMVGGQAMELSASMPLTPEKQERIYRLKTGALFSVALELTGIVADVSSKALTILARLGDALGLSYQLQDDISDNAPETQKLITSKDRFQAHLAAALSDLKQVLPNPVRKQFISHLAHLFPEQCIVHADS